MEDSKIREIKEFKYLTDKTTVTGYIEDVNQFLKIVEALNKGNIHLLKTLPIYFWDVVGEVKKFEVRRNDRRFKVGDILVLLEFDENENYTGFACSRKITYILLGGQFGVEKGFCVLGVEKWFN